MDSLPDRLRKLHAAQDRYKSVESWCAANAKATPPRVKRGVEKAVLDLTKPE